MTATSVLSPSPLTRSWSVVQRALVLVLTIALFVAIAFAAGRASVNVHHSSTVIAPAAVSVPSVASPAPSICRVGPC